MLEAEIDNSSSVSPAPVNRGGRPKGSRDKLPRVRGKESFREMYDNEVAKNAGKIVKAAIRAATRGDSRALTDVLNRVLGQPKATLELSGPGGAPIAIQAATATALALMSTAELQALASFAAKTGQSNLAPQAPRARLAASTSHDLDSQAIYPPNPDIDGHDANSTSPKASEATDHTELPQPDQDTPEPEPAQAVPEPELG